MEVAAVKLKKEVSKFRSSFGSDEISNAEKSLYLEKKGEVGLLVFDAFNEKANKLSTPIMLRLFDLLSQVESDKSLKSLVLVSRKPSIFIAGADINEIKKFGKGESSADSLMKLQSVFTFLENLPIPSIAAIHGAALGGGLELCLACDYRFASDSKETRLGLPEVQLGVLPGWGGTQRLPKIIGLQSALDLILTGRHLNGKSAKKLGLVDKNIPFEYLEEKAIAFAKQIGGKKRSKHGPTLHGIAEQVLETVPGGNWIVFEQAKKSVLKKTKGNYPAPLKIIEVLHKTYGGKLEEGLKVEAQAFCELVVTPECKNLIDLFFLNESVKKDSGVDSKIKGKPVDRAGVVGAGVMGGGIAQLFAAKGVRTRMKDINWKAISLGYKSAYSIFEGLYKKRKLSRFELSNSMELIEGATSYAGFKTLDLVVEAVVENLDIKKAVFKELDNVTDPKAVLATNTSSLSVTAIASQCQDPTRVVGMHFFNPVHKMPLVEIIRGEKTSDEAVATIVSFSKKLGKTPVVVKDAPGFVVNRILGPYLNEAVHLLLDGVDAESIDSIAEKFGMPMGPCTLLDEVGLDVASKVAKVLFGAFGDRMKPPEMMDKITEGGRLGKKSGKGIFLYENGKRTSVDESFLRKFNPKSRPAPLTDEAVERRLIYVMINEAARIVQEGIVRKVSDLDVAMIFGTGFAPFRGGLLKYADSVGAESVVGDLEMFSRNYGARFQPCDTLQAMAVNKTKFYNATT